MGGSNVENLYLVMAVLLLLALAYLSIRAVQMGGHR
jgi:hypothetical protein